MVFQDPMTSLNPVKKIGTALTESMRFHLGLNKADGPGAGGRAAHPGRHPRAGAAPRRVPAPALRRHAPAGHDRHRDLLLAEAADRRRADDRARRDRAAPDPRPAQSLQADYEMAMVMITHDLGVVAGRADRVAVMYAGRVVETAQTRDLFATTRHPYTEALLESIPKIEQPSHTPPRGDHRPSAGPGRPRRPVCRFSAAVPVRTGSVPGRRPGADRHRLGRSRRGVLLPGRHRSGRGSARPQRCPPATRPRAHARASSRRRQRWRRSRDHDGADAASQSLRGAKS